MIKCYKKDYPRPQMVRDNWFNLNGAWDFSFDDQNTGEKDKWYESFPSSLTIQVPFTYETKLSGIQDEKRHDTIWYHKTIEVDSSKLEKNRYVLHFEGSDFITKVWVNGTYAGSHRGGYARFSFDITNLVADGSNELVVKVEDSYDMQQPRGKQRWMENNFGCWYVQTTGIWKTVWAEYVPNISLDYIKMTPNMQDFSLDLEFELNAWEEILGADTAVETIITYEGALISKTVTTMIEKHMEAKAFVFTKKPEGFEWGIKTWSPDTPNLYDIEFRLIHNGETYDEIGSYFAMREIRIDGQNVLLNGRPLYQRLILDQGYWKDSHLTPPNEEALIEDIDKIHELGYNGLRKHQKIEDERFLLWCDVKGMLVWSEAAAAYQYTDYAVEEFTREWMEIVKQNYNHPCIITWTPFNESWGVNRIGTNRLEQHFTEAIYHLTKSVDKHRPVIVNDGWEHTVSDIITLHDYEEVGEILRRRYMEYKEDILNGGLFHNNYKAAMAKGFAYKGQPIIISEYGGIAFNNDDSGWGYGNKVSTKEDFIHRFDEITTAVKEIPYVSGFCYTQVSDVQQEINGLMDMERNFKIDPKIIKEINERKIGYWRSYM
ncbi:glycoside hydrolase family 2 TIM barrel-domain containing protein [Anaerocolumna sp. AGMB13025]|uniref:glycoside hydrolase family 2 protein n=1 Tax=Anaerocolumna sp. AGMB13025 TaxID=3039116 RepID=UPI00241D86AA|nr:sugar-binding domain-containing protein [Anaerocolumna sp. AGMB13025]WFR56741.1 glycoside hydrolase family 2 TIM barrel-domain containing protein [Anaerocolumna sp. AGMB13025]